MRRESILIYYSYQNMIQFFFGSEQMTKSCFEAIYEDVVLGL